MKFGLNDTSLIMNHLLLQNNDLIPALIETPEWKNDKEFHAKVTINGVEIPAESYEKFMMDQWKSIERDLKERYDTEAFDARVKEAAENLLKDHAEKLIDSLGEMSRNVDEIVNDAFNRNWPT